MENDWLISGGKTIAIEQMASQRKLGCVWTLQRERAWKSVRENHVFNTAPAGRGPYKLIAGEWVEV